MADNQTRMSSIRMNIIGFLQQVIGWFITVIFGLTTISCLAQLKESDDVAALIIIIGVTAGGVYLIFLGNKNKKLIKKFKNYSNSMAADPTKSIDLIAASTGDTVEIVTRNLTEMIKKGFYQNAYIDTGRNCLVFQNAQETHHKTGSEPASAEESFITIQCKGCGATNKIAAGTVGECEFCGSKISE